MRRSYFHPMFVVLFAATVAAGLPSLALAKDVGTILWTTGQASVYRDLQDRGANPLTVVGTSDVLRTSFGSRMKVLLEDGGMLLLDYNSELRIRDSGENFAGYAPDARFELIKGIVRIVAPQDLASGRAYIVESNSTRFVLQKTDSMIRRSPDGSHTDVIVLEGRAIADMAFSDESSNQAESMGSVTVEQGFMSVAPADSLPTAPVPSMAGETETVRSDHHADLSVFGGGNAERLIETLQNQAWHILDERVRESGMPLMPIYGPQATFSELDRPTAVVPPIPKDSSTVRVEWTCLECPK